MPQCRAGTSSRTGTLTGTRPRTEINDSQDGVIENGDEGGNNVGKINNSGIISNQYLAGGDSKIYNRENSIIYNQSGGEIYNEGNPDGGIVNDGSMVNCGGTIDTVADISGNPPESCP